MTPAKVIKFPTPEVVAAEQPAKASFTRLDNATDMATLYELPNALLKPALCLLEHRHMRPLHWGEVATAIGRGATQTREALNRLAELGYAVADGDSWSWAGSIASRKPVRKVARKPVRKSEFSPPEKTVWGGISLSLKEVNEVKKEINTNNIYSLGIDWPAQFPPTAVGGGAAEKNLGSVTSEGQAPDGVASSEASTDNPSHSQVKNVSSEEKNENAPESETVPPAAPPALAPPETYREAQEVLSSAGFWDVWQKWVKSHRLSRAAQDLQIIDFAVWVQVGLGEILRQHAHEITKLGSFGHPFAGLQGRMQAALAVKKAEQHNVAEVVRVFGVPQCQAGERRRDPATGKVWTVEEIAYGMVIFEEGAAPMNAADVTVAGWEVVT